MSLNKFVLKLRDLINKDKLNWQLLSKKFKCYLIT